MTDLVDRLRAALDHAEEAARAASPGPWRLLEDGEVESAPLTEGDWMRAHVAGYFGHYEVRTPEEDCAFIAANDPVHVLRTIAAHRRIVERHRPALERPSPLGTLCHYCSPGEAQTEHPCADLRDIASIYLTDTAQGEPR
jgi:hypothetical protein